MKKLSDYLEFTPRNDLVVQHALREIDTEVLASALGAWTKELREVIFRNMSSRACAILGNEADQVDSHPEPEKSARSAAFFESLLDACDTRVPREPEATRMVVPAVSSASPRELTESFSALAGFVRRYGFAPLEALKDTADHPLFSKGIELLVDGYDPLLVRSILESRKKALLAQEAALMDMILEGMDSLGQKDLPGVCVEKVSAHRLD